MNHFHVNLNGKLYDFSKHKVMSIINITPDSFYEESRVFCFDNMLRKIEQDINHGADFFDIGGYSSRPDGCDISVEQEIERVCKAVDKIKERFSIALSIDTFRSKVIENVVHNFGSVIVNDISAGELDDKIIDVAAKYKLPYIAMHMRGTPQTMQSMCQYNDVVNDIITYFVKRCEYFRVKGVSQLIIDPGFGFAKTIEQNFEILRRLKEFEVLKLPILAGISRKSMIYKTLNITANEALNGTSILNWQALTEGATILRVHDVKEAKEVIKLYQKMLASENIIEK